MNVTTNFVFNADTCALEDEPSTQGPLFNYSGSFVREAVQAFQQQEKVGPHNELQQYLNSGVEETTNILSWWGVSLIDISKHLYVSNWSRATLDTRPWSGLHRTTLQSKGQQPIRSVHSAVGGSPGAHEETGCNLMSLKDFSYLRVPIGTGTSLLSHRQHSILKFWDSL